MYYIIYTGIKGEKGVEKETHNIDDIIQAQNKHC